MPEIGIFSRIDSTDPSQIAEKGRSVAKWIKLIYILGLIVNIAVIGLLITLFTQDSNLDIYNIDHPIIEIAYPLLGLTYPIFLQLGFLYVSHKIKKDLKDDKFQKTLFLWCMLGITLIYAFKTLIQTSDIIPFTTSLPLIYLWFTMANLGRKMDKLEKEKINENL